MARDAMDKAVEAFALKEIDRGSSPAREGEDNASGRVAASVFFHMNNFIQNGLNPSPQFFDSVYRIMEKKGFEKTVYRGHTNTPEEALDALMSRKGGELLSTSSADVKNGAENLHMTIRNINHGYISELPQEVQDRINKNLLNVEPLSDAGYTKDQKHYLETVGRFRQKVIDRASENGQLVSRASDAPAPKKILGIVVKRESPWAGDKSQRKIRNHLQQEQSGEKAGQDR